MSRMPARCPECGLSNTRVRSINMPVYGGESYPVTCCDDCLLKKLQALLLTCTITWSDRPEIVRVDDTTVRANCPDTEDGVYR